MIIRKKLEGNYTRIPNEFILDETISDKARGTLARLLSRPDTWNVNVNHLVKTGTDGHTAVRSSITELIKAGYIHRDVTREKSGRITGTQYLIFDRRVPPADARAAAGAPTARTATDKTTPVTTPAQAAGTGPAPGDTHAQSEDRIRETMMRETGSVVTNKGNNNQGETTTTTQEPVDQEIVIEATTTSPSSFPARDDINFLFSLVPEHHRKPTIEKLISDALGNHDRRSIEEAVVYSAANVKGGWMQYRAYLDKTLQNGWAAGYLDTITPNTTRTMAVSGGFAGGMPAGRFPNGTVTGCKRMDSNYMAAAQFLARRRARHDQ